MIRSALIIVPHPDDEINLAGGLYDTLYENNIYTTVVVCTNGDYFPEDATKRYYESKKTKKILKYQEIIYLGYGDGYQNKHIYDAAYDEMVISHCGRSHTYCGGDGYEYCYKKTGKHHSYTYGNLKEDIRSIILDTRADLIICVDIDSHVDHRCISLIFDECIGEILKNDNYKPYILKGFAYNGVWFGPDDFFDDEIKPASIVLKPGEDIKKKVFPYYWHDRVRIKSSKKSQSLLFWANPIFKALKANKTQCDYYKVGFCALSSFPRIANPDSCYWYRNPYNLSLSSDIDVSSGNAQYLNDFMLLRPGGFISEDLSVNSIGWKPDVSDKEPRINIKFPHLCSLEKIVIFQNYDSKICNLRIKTDGGYENEFNCSNSCVIEILLPSVKSSVLTITFLSFNSNLTINEIECYNDQGGFPWKDTPFVEYIDTCERRNYIVVRIVKVLFKIFVRFVLLSSRIKSKLNN